MFKHHTVFSYLIVISLALFLHGCSFSKSSEGSSDSVSSIISSPSNSSKTDDKYQREIQDYTLAYVKSSEADYASFQKGLTDIANSHGVVDWEHDSTTYVAIGRGLKKAGLKGVPYETYKMNLTGSDIPKMLNIQEGYDSK